MRISLCPRSLTAVGLRSAAALGFLMAAACGSTNRPATVEPTAESQASAAAASAAAEARAPAPAATAVADVATSAKGDSDHVVMDSETLRLESTPEVPAAMRERFNHYLGTRSAGLSDISADGQEILITTRFGTSSQAHWVRSPMSARTQLTFGTEPARSPQFMLEDPNAVVYVADIGGNEQHQIFRLDRKTGLRHRLTDAKARNSSPLWSKDGKWMAFSSNSRDGRNFDIWVSDGKGPESARLLGEFKGWWAATDWSPDGKTLLAVSYQSVNQSSLYAIDVASGTRTRISPPPAEGQKVAYPYAVFGADNKTIYALSDREGEFNEIYRTDLSGKEWRSLTRAIPWNVNAMAMSPDGRTLAFASNEDGYSKLRLLDTRNGRMRALSAIPKGMISSLQFAARAPTLAFTLSSATRTGDVYSYDLRRRRLTQWTESELGGLNRDNLVEPELIRYASFDDREIPAFYYRPQRKGPYPVIINIHGGPESQARPRFSPLTQFLVAEAGFAVIYPNVRGSNGYGKSYLTLDNGKKREESVKDIGALLDWIAQQPELDEKRVGVLGGSYGGYMVLASLVHFGERIAAGVDIVGISNFVTFLQNTADYRRDLRRVEYGDERDPDMRAHLEQISPANHADKIQSPLFVAQGANDPRVPASEAEQIVAAVREAGHDVWYMLAKNEGHGFAKKENRDLYYLLTTLFFEKHLR